jgi:hypothetical protein
MICLDCDAFHKTEKMGFRRLIADIIPQYKIK